MKRRRKISADQIEEAENEIVERSRKIDFYLTEYTVELLAEKMNRKEFVIPDYQREDTWETARKSRFVESLIMGLPVPFLFFWEMETGKLEIVDGSQRLRTIQRYLNDELKLSTLAALPSLSGTYFSDLPPSRQRKIKNRSIRGIVLNEHADIQARLDMFERINTGSKVANPAEVRRGALRGPFQDLVMDLAQNDLLAKLAPVSAKSEGERIPEELVARFFAYGDGLDDYKENPAYFTFEYTKRMNDEFQKSPELADSYRERFMSMLDFVDKTFPTGFRKTDQARSTPRVRFEAIAIGSYLALEQRPKLATGIPPDVTGWINGEDFEEVTTSDAANVKSKLQKRINFVMQKLLESQ
ncbi:MAG: DUF262 domain-containing protein [Pigmentiphaga sp.]